MAHPRMFADDDPYLARVREFAGALPDSTEKVSHRRLRAAGRRIEAVALEPVRIR